MPLIQWNDSLSVGIPSMDTQHQKLINIINRLHDAMREGKGKDIISPVLTELHNYTVTHFTAEEKLMEQCKYSGLAVQKQQHNNFVNQIKKYQSDYEKGSLTLPLSVSNYLKDWLINHIQGLDKKYETSMKSAGIK
ncbi:MAG: bacteriohemerythrin [Candidatus Hydrogenedens sp.]